MPQSSYAYAVARVRALEPRLLSRERLARMAEAGNAEEVMRLLQEIGYGVVGELKNIFDYEMLLAHELGKTYELIDKISPNPGVTDLFRFKWDVHNLKVMLKNRLQGFVDDKSLFPYGTIPLETLHRAVHEKAYKGIPPRLQEALIKLEKSFAARVDPQRIGVELDKALMQCIFDALAQRPDAFAEGFFRAQCDLTNVLTLLRCRKRGYAPEEIEAQLLPPGELEHSLLVSMADQPRDALARALSKGAASAAIARGLESYAQTDSLTAMEKAADEFLISLVRKRRFECFSIAPVIGYLIAREQEAKAIRLIMVAKLNGLNEAILKERLRDLYA